MSKTNKELPIELWNEVFGSMREPDSEGSGMVIYRGEKLVGAEKKRERYETLSNLSLSSKYLRPIAQRELLSRIHLQSEESLVKLVEALERSTKLQEIAKAAKSVFFGEAGDGYEIAGGLIERMARKCYNVSEVDIDGYGMSLSLSDITHFERLERLQNSLGTFRLGAPLQPLLHLKHLRLYYFDFEFPAADDQVVSRNLLDSFFSSITLPALSQMDILDYYTESFELDPTWGFNLPQITRLTLDRAPVHTLALLDGAASLRVLRITVDSIFDESPISVLVQALSAFRLDEFYFAIAFYPSSEEPDSDFVFSILDKLMEAVRDSRSIKVLAIEVPDIYDDWEESIDYKRQLAVMCTSKDITLVKFGDCEHHDCLSVGEKVQLYF